MKRKKENKNMEKVLRKLTVFCLLLFALTGSAWAQNDRQYVIEKGGHYLSHAGGTLQDATDFSPDCIWYSSNNYNYYFMDGTTRKYLNAPLALNGTLSIGDNPGTQTLNNSTLNYFFWDWDHGLARGVLHLEGGDCPYNSPGSQCWEVVWVSYEGGTWKMSSGYGYEPTANSARFLRVTITEHAEALSNEVGGVGNLVDFAMNYQDTHALDGTASALSCVYTPAYRQYHIDGLDDDEHNTHIQEVSYYYYGGQYYTDPPTTTTYTNATASGYAWSLSGDGAQYLSFNETNDLYTINGATPSVYYIHENTTTSHKLATLTLAVTYTQNDSQVTQTRTATVTVKIECQNPTVLEDNTVVTYVGVTVLWLPTAESYEVSWKKDGTDTWSSITVGDVTSYTITGLDYDADYYYKVSAICGGTVQSGATQYSFKTLKEPGLMVNGAIFGGGRMANVGGNTEIVIVNCDSIGGIYGGNDIAGAVQGSNGAKITLGVNADNVNGYDVQYGTTPANVTLKFGDVYGGGNGYYAYDGSSFEAASANYTSYTVQPGESVKAMTQSHQVGDIVWTNTGSASVTLDFPSIVKTEILVSDNYVTADSIFGGAKNAFLTYNGTQEYPDGSLITIDGGTIMAVFGGNNFGGKQGYGQHHIVVNKTTTSLTPSINNTATTGYGRDFGIRYLFGGGNKVYGSTTNVQIFGGQCDSIFAGGNSADVYAANVTVNCAMQALSTDYTYGNVYSNAINTYVSGTITPKDDYGWDGFGGIYNVRTLFGGNNMATFDSQLHQKVPIITLTSGSLGTVYGGGNSGDMWGYNATTINGETVNYGTHVKMENQTVLVDYLYGGCQMSNVRYSTWVQIQNGHVGTVYGGCNISGDVGSTRVNMNAAQFISEGNPNPEYQVVYGGTYVEASGGTVYNNLFGGGNGYYHCLDDNGYYTSTLSYTDHDYSGLASPTHNETHVVVNTGATIKGNVYAGGNLACVGFSNNTALVNDDQFPRYVGLSSVRMSGGHVYGNVYGGCNMSNVYGSNEVQVSGGTIDESLYGGNDRLGTVATPISNRVLPPEYQIASDNITSLVDPKVYTYVGLTGNPSITNVYGGGNGDYYYCTSDAAAQAYLAGGGEKEPVVSCDISNQPIQQCTFVDVGVDGGDATGAHIGTVYGGGDGVTVTGFAKVFLNVKTNPIGFSNVGTIFGGNNKGDLLLVPDIILLNGQVNTVYGGCNMGAMTAGSNENAHTKTIVGAHGDTFEDVGSYVHLLASYDGDGEGGHAAVTPNIKVMDAIYGGCRMNGVTRNSLVLVEGGDFSSIPIFGGSDISGTVSGTSTVAVTDGTVGNVYGGGNGNYTYNNNGNVYTIPTSGDPVLVATGVTTAPICVNSGVDVLGGSVGTSTLFDSGTIKQVFGGGLGKETSTTGNVEVNVDGASTHVYGEVYGGSALGSVNTFDMTASTTTTVNILNGTLHGNIYGGGLGQKNGVNGATSDIAAQVNGKVYVNIGAGITGVNPTYTGNATIEGMVYGCNNLNGSPQDSVFVNVYKTAHGVDAAHNLYPSEPSGGWTVENLETNASTQAYAISYVFGGGNKAAYTPQLTAGGDPRCATVHVYDCQSNTIQYVFGGGDAADVGINNGRAGNTHVIIDGGRIHQVYGGGNGYSATGNHNDPSAANYNPGANIFGTASTTINAGLIDEIFGGANQWGSVDIIDLNVSNSATCSDQVYGKVFGCANEAPYNRSVTTTIECGVGTIGELYGGSNKAAIGDSEHPNTGVDVTLNLYGGGPYDNVFAGSKGIANGAAAPIYGNVTLNLYGGTALRAFGGSDKNGNITGKITVNVLDLGTCGLSIDTIFGASNETDYTPDSPYGSISPEINVMYIAESSHVNYVFGGGNNAAVYDANPQVNIGYDESTMSTLLASLVPANWSQTQPSDFPRAYVTHDVFGGGNKAAVEEKCTVTMRLANSRVKNIFGGGNKAGVGSAEINVINGTVANDVYGGCNTQGTVTGDIAVNVTGGTVANDVFGGGLGTATATQGGILVTIDGGTVSRDVYGGSALGQVNDAAADLTKVNLKSGTITGNLYGGGMGAVGQSANGRVNGHVEVLVEGGTVTNVFGCNNYNDAPQGTVTVTIEGGTVTNVFGGGNVADYSAPAAPNNNYPYVHITGGTVTHKVVGGGNEASITGNPHILIAGGTLCTSSDTEVGIYGGCNTTGTVTGDVTLTITGGTIGDQAVVLAQQRPVNVHGGGYGQATLVTGDVTVNYGDITAAESLFPKLYGNLYGGSALGNVNTNSGDKTTVNVYNGSIVAVNETVNGHTTYYSGNVFGGGLGRKADPAHSISAVEAKVYGEVHVNIGKSDAPPSSDLAGKVTLIDCNVYGCNNTAGSPQADVYVDVYQTAHITGTNTTSDQDFAILHVFGGGNEANYEPENNNPYSQKKAHVYVHGCENTIKYVYGGGNAADAIGVETRIEGGHFSEVYGGGNGLVIPANIGYGGVGILVTGGTVGYLYEGCNKHGNIDPNGSGIHAIPAYTGFIQCDELFIEDYYFGTNEAESYYDIVRTITCAQAAEFHYTRVFAGSRWAIVYGDIKLTVEGGNIEWLFGGSKGYKNESVPIPADVRRFPTAAELAADEALPEAQRKYSESLRAFMSDPEHAALAGHGGNIELIIHGGTIGNVVGGCDELGNVEGKITVIVDSIPDPYCPLFVGTVYGANNQAHYEPLNNPNATADALGINNYSSASINPKPISAPEVKILRGTIGGKALFGKPSALVLKPYEGNVFGGCDAGNVKSNPIVLIGEHTNTNSVNVKGNVYGGCDAGNVTGSPEVIVVPKDYTLTITKPGDGNLLRITDEGGNPVVLTGTGTHTMTLDEYANLWIEAIPNAYSSSFTNWNVTNGSSVVYKNKASTIFTMGASDATLGAVFGSATPHTFSVVVDPVAGGSVTIHDGQGNTVSSGASISEGAVLYIEATANAAYAFDQWSVSGNGSIGYVHARSTTFTMGTSNVTITAKFESAPNKLTYSQPANGHITVTDEEGLPVSSGSYVVANTVLDIVAEADPEYAFSTWTATGGTIAEAGVRSTRFTMGDSGDATISATFVSAPYTLTFGLTPALSGTVSVKDQHHQHLNSGSYVANGTVLDIVATPAVGYTFDHWEISPVGGGTIDSTTTASTTFTMGNAGNVTITAHFSPQ